MGDVVWSTKEVGVGGCVEYRTTKGATIVNLEMDASVIEEFRNVPPIQAQDVIGRLPRFGRKIAARICDNGVSSVIIFKEDCEEAIMQIAIDEVVDNSLGTSSQWYVLNDLLNNRETFLAASFILITTVNGPKGILIPVMGLACTGVPMYTTGIKTSEVAGAILKEFERRKPALEDVNDGQRFVDEEADGVKVWFNRNHNAYNGKQSNAQMAAPIVAASLGVDLNLEVGDDVIDFLKGMCDNFVIDDGSNNGENVADAFTVPRIKPTVSSHKEIDRSGTALHRLGNMARSESNE